MLLVLTPYCNPGNGIVLCTECQRCLMWPLSNLAGLGPWYLHYTGVLSSEPYNMQCAAY
jgi:hypothetical protein